MESNSEIGHWELLYELILVALFEGSKTLKWAHSVLACAEEIIRLFNAQKGLIASTNQKVQQTHDKETTCTGLLFIS